MRLFDIQSYLSTGKQMIDAELERVLCRNNEIPRELHEAMRYCLFAGGKRLRPILALAAAEAVGGKADAVIREACALELLHTYTLVHDDLPSMDNDDYRRGRRTTHKVFGEAIAILAGDALQAEAFALLAGGVQHGRHAPDKIAQVIQTVANACGARGVVGGQVVDILSEGKAINSSTLEYIHTHKTGCLITASVMLGVLLASTDLTAMRHLETYGNAIGLAFQITDDILDVLGSSEKLGKTVGADEKRGKATYPALLGLEQARSMQTLLHQKALDALQCFDEKADPLRHIARVIIERSS